jgi:hypothetical protein
MVALELMAKNQASWAEVFADIDEYYPENDTWGEWKEFMHALLRAGVEEHLDKYFRAGQSMHYIIFSTCERHGLKRHDPHVVLGRDHNGYFVVYSRDTWWSLEPGVTPDRKDVITSTNALAVWRSHQLALWRETRPSEPIPPVFVLSA